jgi:hypothetical protein
MICALVLSVLLSSTGPPEVVFADDFEDGLGGALYAWSSIEPAPGLPWWRRQWPIEDCPTYAARYASQDLWEACPFCDYWKRSCGTNTGHRCDLGTGDEFLWVIFWTDFDAPHIACWDDYEGLKTGG